MKEIVVCLLGKEDEVLARQISMLSERHHVDVRRISFDEADGCIAAGDGDVFFISDDEAMLDKARAKGMAVNSPQKMRESYEKAMEMLKALGGRPQL